MKGFLHFYYLQQPCYNFILQYFRSHPTMLYTSFGKKILSPKAYAKTGAPMYKYDSSINKNSKTFIYILNLEYNKIYIGKTTNFTRRMKEHWTGQGSRVTKKFKPLKASILTMCNGYFSDEREQKYTKKYIKTHGYENVRGGYYTNSNTLHAHNQKYKFSFSV